MTNAITRRYITESAMSFSSSNARGTRGAKNSGRSKSKSVKTDRQKEFIKQMKTRKTDVGKLRQKKTRVDNIYSQKQYGPWKKHIQVLDDFDDPALHYTEITGQKDYWMWEARGDCLSFKEFRTFQTNILQTLQYEPQKDFYETIEALWQEYIFWYESAAYESEAYESEAYESEARCEEYEIQNRMINTDHMLPYTYSQEVSIELQNKIYDEKAKVDADALYYHSPSKYSRCPNCGYTM